MLGYETPLSMFNRGIRSGTCAPESVRFYEDCTTPDYVRAMCGEFHEVMSAGGSCESRWRTKSSASPFERWIEIAFVTRHQRRRWTGRVLDTNNEKLRATERREDRGGVAGPLRSLHGDRPCQTGKICHVARQKSFNPRQYCTSRVHQIMHPSTLYAETLSIAQGC